MVNDNYSCIKEVTKVVHLSLPTIYRSNEIKGICDALESWKRQYVPQLQGIVVGYKDVSLTSKHGYIKLDSRDIHYNVTATFELFYPTVGSIVKGKINRVSQDYISCLVHNTINVALQQTCRIPSDISKFLVLDHFILFQVTHLKLKKKFIHVKGKITEECINLMRDSDEFQAEVEVSDSNELTCTSPDFSNNNYSVNKNKITTYSSPPNSPLEPKNYNGTSSQSSSPSKKKKRKKLKEDGLTSPSIFSESLDSEVNEIEPTQLPHVTKKKHKKPKTENIAEGITGNLLNVDSASNNREEINNDLLNTSSSSTKSHKKKKSKKLKNDSPEKNLTPNSVIPENLFLGQQNSVDKSDDLSSSKKKKKRKKSEENTFESPPNFDEPPKKKHKKSKSEDVDEVLMNNFNSMLSAYDCHSDSSDSLIPPIKLESESPVKNNNNEIKEAFSSVGPLLNDHTGKERVFDDEKSSDVAKQGKKRKRESDVASLPKKKRKKSTSDKSKNKIRKKKKKDKSKEDSKKDKKKKSKSKVLSTKKRLHGYKSNLKKKKKDKSHKSSKSSKKSKSSKEKSKNVPEPV